MIKELIHLMPKLLRLGPPNIPEDFKYEFGKPYDLAWGAWKHWRGTSKADGAPVSIFSLSVRSDHKNQEELLAMGRNGIKHLKKLQDSHKKLDILLLLDDCENTRPDGSSTTIFVITEPVMPLSELLKKLCICVMDVTRNLYCESGFYQIAKVVNYFHDHLQVVHGNICLASVVVTQTPQMVWKLHWFDLLSEAHNFTVPSTCSMQHYRMFVESQYIPPELRNYGQTNYPWAIDSWGLSCLMYEVFTGKLARPEDLDNSASIPTHILRYFYRLTCENPSSRLQASYIRRAFGGFSTFFLRNVRYESNRWRVDKIFLEKVHKNIKKFRNFPRYFFDLNGKRKLLKIKEQNDLRRSMYEYDSMRYYKSPVPPFGPVPRHFWSDSDEELDCSDGCESFDHSTENESEDSDSEEIEDSDSEEIEQEQGFPGRHSSFF